MLQSRWRRICAQRFYLGKLKDSRAALVLQTAWRRFSAQQIYCLHLQKIHAATVIQMFWKTFLTSFSTRSHAAVKIQAAWRGFWTCVKFQMQIMDIIDVQRIARRWLAVRQRMIRSNAARAIQSAVRCYLAKKRVVIAAIEYWASVRIQVSLFHLFWGNLSLKFKLTSYSYTI